MPRCCLDAKCGSENAASSSPRALSRADSWSAWASWFRFATTMKRKAARFSSCRSMSTDRSAANKCPGEPAGADLCLGLRDKCSAVGADARASLAFNSEFDFFERADYRRAPASFDAFDCCRYLRSHRAARKPHGLEVFG